MRTDKSVERQTRTLRGSNSGGSILEYALVIGTISVVIGFLAPEIGGFIGGLFEHVGAQLNEVNSATR